jgi:hypothetical protein
MVVRNIQKLYLHEKIDSKNIWVKKKPRKQRKVDKRFRFHNNKMTVESIVHENNYCRHNIFM